MASEIARIAQRRVVEVDRVSFECGNITLKMVKTTTGGGWLLNDDIIFTSIDQAIKAFYDNIQVFGTKDNDNYYNIFMSGTLIYRFWIHAGEKPFSKAIADILKNPPTVVHQ